MTENKWVNAGIAVAVAGALTGVAVWMSAGQPVEQVPDGDRSGQVDGNEPAAPADRPAGPITRNETEAAPPDMGGALPKPTKE